MLYRLVHHSTDYPPHNMKVKIKFCRIFYLNQTIIGVIYSLYSTLVVDDEPKHRKGLINIIKQFRPDYNINGAKNGQEALEFILSNDVEILITDVKMPIMDGLELTKRVMALKKDIKVIILSAYAHFEYAQKAIALGAFDYLLKPIDSEGIAVMLRKVEDRIKLERGTLLEKKNLEAQLKNTLPVYLEMQLNRWVNKGLNEIELKEISQIFPFKGKGAIIACEIEGSKNKDENYDPEEKDEIKQNIKYWMKEALNSLGHSLSFFLHSDEQIMITILNVSKDTEFHFSEKLNIFNELIEHVKLSYEIKITIGLSNESDNIFDQIGRAYMQAITALSYKFYYEKDSIISFSQINHENNASQVTVLKEEKELMIAIRQLQDEKVNECVAKLFERTIYNGLIQPQRFKEVVSTMILNQIRIFQELMNEEFLDKLKTDALGRIACCKTYSQMKNETVNIVSHLISTQISTKKTKHDDIMKKCIQYIDTNFKDDISLEYMAELFYFNASYFGSLFKSINGITFSQYLQKVRINKAKEYLKNTAAKVYELASGVGYSDPKYFIRVFKNEVGFSPAEYRRIVLSKKSEETV